MRYRRFVVGGRDGDVEITRRSVAGRRCIAVLQQWPDRVRGPVEAGRQDDRTSSPRRVVRSLGVPPLRLFGGPDERSPAVFGGADIAGARVALETLGA